MLKSGKAFLARCFKHQSPGFVAAVSDLALNKVTPSINQMGRPVKTEFIWKRIADLWPYILLAIALIGLAYRLWIGRF